MILSSWVPGDGRLAQEVGRDARCAMPTAFDISRAPDNLMWEGTIRENFVEL